MFLSIKFKYLIVFTLLACSALLAGEWHTVQSLTTPRAGASAVVWNNQIYVFGGKSGNGSILNTVERYDPKTSQWDEQSIPNFSEARFNAAAALFENEIYLIGGHGDDDVLDNVEVYDPVQNSWSDAQSLQEKREGLSAVIMNGKIYVVGGQQSSSSFEEDIEWYDKDDDEWDELDDELPYKRTAHFAAASRDTFYMFGGYYSFSLFNTTYKSSLKDSDNVWFSGNDISEGRYYGATTQIGDSLFLIGGETTSGKTNLVEIFNTSSGQFSVGNPMLTVRSGITAVAMGDSIFVIGGFGINGEVLNDVEMYIEHPTAIGHTVEKPIIEYYILIKGYPNPFNGRINFKIQLVKNGQYDIAVYDVCGHKVKNLYSGYLNPGEMSLHWTAENQRQNNVSSGVYFLVVKSANNFERLKIVYVK